jgi:predicted lipid-binding transport protein (Tim44 family)
MDMAVSSRPPVVPPSKRDEVERLVLKHDPGFSLVLFEDFACALYAESQRARHDPRALSGLAPYWTKTQMESLKTRAPVGQPVRAVVVGGLTPEAAFEENGRICIEYSFETNLHIQIDSGPPKSVETPGALSSLLVNTGLASLATQEPRAITQYVNETWTFSRDMKVQTRPWTGVRKLGCPNCGAPLSPGGDARCGACGQVGDGRFDWQVSVVLVNAVEEKPHSFTGTSEEVGTSWPTKFSKTVSKDLDGLLSEDSALNPESIEARLRLIFNTMQSAWSSQDLRPLRPFVSDRQYDSLQYWIEAYKEQGLRNLMARPRLDNFRFARVGRDAHYDALTLRIWASGCDYTVEAKTGRVVGGSRTTPRRYSEYWTLIRSARARGKPRLDHNCPGCGVPLALNMAGGCEHCGAHVTSGEFDWVLSKIEQDEAYRG